MKTVLAILLALVVCIYFLTKPTAENIDNNEIEQGLIDTSNVAQQTAQDIG